MIRFNTPPEGSAGTTRKKQKSPEQGRFPYTYYFISAVKLIRVVEDLS